MGSIVNTVEGRSRKVKALVSNEDSKLIPGMFAHVEVILLQRDNALCVPVSAFPDIERDTSTVWVIQGEDKVTQRQITVEHFNLEKALVDTGLQPGDLVVVDITSVKLEDGMQVEIVEVREPPKEEG
jgi:multidrug efflux pump subunit AcrA (membrane-fusion protein)